MSKERIYFLLIIIFWGVILYGTTISNFNYSPFNVTKGISIENRMLLPQGWGFFTKNPREEQLYIYKKGSNGLYQKVLRENFSIQNFFGLSRKNRIMLNEMAISVLAIPDSLWTNTRKKVPQINMANHGIEIKNKSRNPLLCGEFLLKKEAPIPWVWRKNKKLSLHKKYVLINLICNN